MPDADTNRLVHLDLMLELLSLNDSPNKSNEHIAPEHSLI